MKCSDCALSYYSEKLDLRICVSGIGDLNGMPVDDEDHIECFEPKQNSKQREKEAGE